MVERFARGMRVRMTAEFKRELEQSNCQDHVREFGDCIGIVEGSMFDGHPELEWDVRWQPSGLKYGYAAHHVEEVRVR